MLCRLLSIPRITIWNNVDILRLTCLNGAKAAAYEWQLSNQSGHWGGTEAIRRGTRAKLSLAKAATGKSDHTNAKFYLQLLIVKESIWFTQ